MRSTGDYCFDQFGSFGYCMDATRDVFIPYTAIEKDVNPFVVGGDAWNARHPQQTPAQETQSVQAGPMPQAVVPQGAQTVAQLSTGQPSMLVPVLVVLAAIFLLK